jgi:hypothetical protein
MRAYTVQVNVKASVHRYATIAAKAKGERVDVWIGKAIEAELLRRAFKATSPDGRALRDAFDKSTTVTVETRRLVAIETTCERGHRVRLSPIGARVGNRVAFGSSADWCQTCEARVARVRRIYEPVPGAGKIKARRRR